MNCQKCNKERKTGSYYEFHYGSTTMSDMGPIRWSPIGKRYRVTTRIEGSRSSWICRACVNKGIILPVVGGTVLCSLLPVIIYSGAIPESIAGLVGVLLFICLFVGIGLIVSGIREIGVSGENRAISANFSELHEAGYDEFLNHRDHENFRKKSLGL